MPSLDTPEQIIGQILGIIGVIISFITYQFKKREQVLISQTVMVTVLAAHYLLIGAYTAMALNLCAIVRNLVYYFKGVFKAPFWKYAVCALMLTAGLITWESPLSLLVTLALVTHTFCLSFKNPQHLRISLLITCPMVFVYDAIVFSLGGMLLESVSAVSALIGIIRFRKKKSIS